MTLIINSFFNKGNTKKYIIEKYVYNWYIHSVPLIMSNKI